MSLEQLKNPPIEEVVCGIVFDPIPQLDPLTIGWFAREVEADFPRRQLQPAIGDSGSVFVGPTPPLRAWLVAEADDLLLQVQHDRFYLNWRARGYEYPRCRDHDGKAGILRRATEEWDRFCAFVRREFDVSPTLRRLELAKIDHLVGGRDWSEQADLPTLLPVLRPLMDLSGSSGTRAAFHLSEASEVGRLTVSVNPPQERPRPDGEVREVVVIESRVTASLSGDDLLAQLQTHNERLNEIFERLIPEEQRRLRFGGET
ncbi:MAG TPA: TIGR04255 family protein [Sandaracinaceae bacterium LLY-WYZ-13_1]|nr:TIGR04255 family protein [Sandaracinaceae bacterium LLY-WYZ-13_1]